MTDPSPQADAVGPSRRRTALSWVLTLAATAATVVLHARFLALDQELPWEDAPGHLGVLVRWQHWFEGGWPLVRDAHSPLLYWVAVLTERAWGPGLDGAVWAVVLFAALLSAGLSRVGFAFQGLSACALLPLLGLATPQLVVYSRMFLLDVPAVAWLPWILLAAWTSDGFRRPVPTLGLGLALAGLALTKLQVGIWVVPVLGVCGLWALARAPWSLVPLALTATPLVRVLAQVQAGAAGPRREDPVLLAQVWASQQTLGLVAGALLAVAALLRWRWPGGWRRISPGVWLSLAAVGCVALVVPWATAAGDEVLAHVTQVTGTNHHGLALNLTALKADLVWTWIGSTRVWLGLALGGLVVEGLARLPALRERPWIRTLAGPLPGPLPLAVLAGVLGVSTWAGVVITGESMPIATRYYLAVWVWGLVVIGLALTRVRVLRWTLAPLLGVLAGVQVGHEGWVALWPGLQDHLHDFVLVSDQRGRTQVPVRRASKAPVIPVPLGPHTAGATPAVERLLRTAHATWPRAGRCGSFLFASQLSSERRSLLSLGALHGLDHCALDDLAQPLTEAPSPTPTAVFLLGQTVSQATDLAATLTRLTGQDWAVTGSDPLGTGGAVSLLSVAPAP